MTLFVDKIIPNDLGGLTNDIRKAEYILALHNISFEKILNQTSETTKIPSAMFGSGKYIISFNFERDLSYVNLGIINSSIELDDNFDLFADAFSPKAIAGFYQIQKQIKEKSQTELNKVELSDNDSDFVIAYGNYIENK